MRSRLPVVVALVTLVLLQANPVFNWFTMRATARAARAAHPNEAHFVDSYVDSATYLIVVWSVLSLLVGATLVVLALLIRRDRRWAKVLLTVGLVGTFLFMLCGVFVDVGSSLWTGPDEWDTVGGSVPGWHDQAMTIVSNAMPLLIPPAIALIWGWPRRPTPPPPPAAPSA